MAPRKRISKIPTRVVAPELVSNDGSTRSIAVQTDVDAPERDEPQPTKRQKILEKIRQLGITKLGMQYSEATSLPVAKPIPKINPYPKGFLCSANEKACQVVETELAKGGTLFRLNANFQNKVDYLKNVMEMRRAESVIWDRNRLKSLNTIINADPPPRWAEASEMWLEVDQLLERIEAYEKEEEKKGNKKP